MLKNRETKVLENGRLIVERYPSEADFSAEASRDDCDSSPALHVEVNHDTMNTIELWDLLAHEWPPWNLPKKEKLKMMEELLKREQGWPCCLTASNISLNEWRKRDPSSTDIVGWYDPQIYVWYNDTSKKVFQMWIAWCKAVLKKKARYVIQGDETGIEKEYNPFEGLRFRVRIEFHD